ncbi:hypothetical protein ANN_27905 [Periplaneta americana]|uniref:Transposase Tc1-like domain-containing protein n=1 Tax=Periplaneta americana TaxID=6978 RepID=A0ABQ8RVG3_PERAM|nr:hypothetical protein ANN_27905 [Periplaneta americana]
MATTGANIHVTTVRRRLLEAGRRARKPIKKQLLTPVMCKKRLMWAKLHQHWTVNDWKNVLFSDESHFEVHGHRVSYVRKGSEKVTAAHLQQAPKYRPKVMFWGCFAHEGPGALIPIKGMINSDKYIHLLETRIVPHLQKSFSDGRGVLQQDLAPFHTSRKTTEFNKKNTQVLPWPVDARSFPKVDLVGAVGIALTYARGCGCKKRNCFPAIAEDFQLQIFSRFHDLATKDEQDMYLQSLIDILDVQRRRPRKGDEARTISSQFTVLLSQSLEFTVSRTTDLQRQFTVLELGSLQLRSTALELRSLQLRSTALELRPSDADADADAHSSRTPAHKTGLLALAFSLTG